MLFSRNYRREWAILKESIVECCSPHRGWPALSLCIFLSFLVLSIWIKTPERKALTEESMEGNISSLEKLEDRLATENAIIEKFDNQINILLDSIEITQTQAKREHIEKPTSLLQKKLQTIKKYAQAPLSQFNQIPTFLTNTPSLDHLIASYNQLQIDRAKSGSSTIKTDLPLGSTLTQVQSAILKSLDSMLKKDLATLEHPIPHDLTRKLNRLFALREEATKQYEQLLNRYRSSFDLLPQQIASTDITENKQLIALKKRGFSSHLWFAFIPSMITLVIGIAIIYCKKHRFARVIRLEDMANNNKTHLHVWTDAYSKKSLLVLLKAGTSSVGTTISITTLDHSTYRQELHENLIDPLLEVGTKLLLIDLSPTEQDLSTYKEHKFLQDYIRNPAIHIEEIIHRDKHLPLDRIFFSPLLSKAAYDNSPSAWDDAYWLLQRSLISDRFKILLNVLKSEQYCVLILQPPPVEPLYFPLYLSCNDVYLNIFKYKVSDRKFAKKIVAQTTSAEKKTINILDKSATYKQFNNSKHEKNN